MSKTTGSSSSSSSNSNKCLWIKTTTTIICNLSGRNLQFNNKCSNQMHINKCNKTIHLIKITKTLQCPKCNNNPNTIIIMLNPLQIVDLWAVTISNHNNNHLKIIFLQKKNIVANLKYKWKKPKKRKTVPKENVQTTKPKTIWTLHK